MLFPGSSPPPDPFPQELQRVLLLHRVYFAGAGNQRRISWPSVGQAAPWGIRSRLASIRLDYFWNSISGKRSQPEFYLSGGGTISSVDEPGPVYLLIVATTPEQTSVR
jgi:hypothetical protein